MQLKLYGKRGIYKDSKLQEQGGEIFEKDGILYNCAFSLCDLGRGLNNFLKPLSMLHQINLFYFVLSIEF